MPQSSPVLSRLLPLALIGTCPVAPAHHGFGSFNVDEEIEIRGTVTDLAFVNPHSWLYLDVRTADGSPAPFRCELRSATTLRRSGCGGLACSV